MKLSARLYQAATPLAILRQRNFGLVWSSMFLVGLGSQMETLVLGWFVLTLTESPFLVGLASSARMAANILALFAGAVADKVSRRLVLATVEFLMAGTGLLMLFLIATDRLEVWHIFVITLFAGLVRIFQMPAAQSLAADSIGEERIGNGVALTNMAMNLSTIIGPLIGGFLFEAYGAKGAYTAIASVYFLSGVSALLVNVTRSGAGAARESVLGLVFQGIKYVKGNQVLWAALVLAAIINLTGFPLHTTLMPVFAKEILGTGSGGLGILMSAFGFGSLLGSLALAALPNSRNAGKLLFLAAVGWHASMVAFGASTSFYLSLAILGFTGMAFSATMVLLLSVLLRTALPEFRGRIMGLRVLAIYAHTFGSLSSGAMASALGAPWAANINAAGGILLAVLLAMIAPKLRRV